MLCSTTEAQSRQKSQRERVQAKAKQYITAVPKHQENQNWWLRDLKQLQQSSFLLSMCCVTQQCGCKQGASCTKVDLKGVPTLSTLITHSHSCLQWCTTNQVKRWLKQQKTDEFPSAGLTNSQNIPQQNAHELPQEESSGKVLLPARGNKHTITSV